MRDKRKPHAEITGRDLELFALLFEYKVATAEQIRRHCFRGAGIRRVYRRLKKLEGMNAVGSSWDGKSKKARKVFHLTPAGKDVLSVYYPAGTSHFQLKSECREHDLVLLEIGKRFSGKGYCIRYMTENVLQSNKEYKEDETLGDFVRLNSDAYLELSFQEKRYNVAIEFENNRKSSRRYRSLVDRYHLARPVDMVFYFHRDAAVKKIIAEHEAVNWPDELPKFYFCEVENGRNWNKKMNLYDREGHCLEI